MKNIDNLFGFEIKTKDVPKLVLKTTETDQLRRYSFNVDLSNLTGEIIDSKAVFMQGDRESSVINANVIQNGKPFDLTGYTVSMNIKENSNELETYICEIENEETFIDGNQVWFIQKSILPVEDGEKYNWKDRIIPANLKYCDVFGELNKFGVIE